jgi:hypothetical protein
VACVEGDDGVFANESWGIARARALSRGGSERLEVDDTLTTSRNVEVVRIVTIEGDPSTSDGMWFGADQLVARPSLDTISVTLRRQVDSSWVDCDFPISNAAGIRLLGPGDTLDPKVKRRISANAWALARSLADSVARAERH